MVSYIPSFAQRIVSVELWEAVERTDYVSANNMLVLNGNAGIFLQGLAFFLFLSCFLSNPVS